MLIVELLNCLLLQHETVFTMKTRLIFALAILVSTWQLKAQVTLPEPLAGKAVTKDYITQNLVYPQSDLEQGNNGKVVIAFHLDENGVASQHVVKSTFSEAASPIALHLVKTILWKPALINGMPSEYEYEYEVEFNAKTYKRHWKRNERMTVPLTMEIDTSYKVYEYKQLNEVAKPYFPGSASLWRRRPHRKLCWACRQQRRVRSC